MLEELKRKVYEANRKLPEYGLVTLTWGNVSGIDREKGIFAIKPSGVSYEALRPEDMVLVDLEGKRVEGELSPSSDTLTHAVLYRSFSKLGGIVHTHSPYATSWAQAGRDIPCYGTTQADYFYGAVPCVRELSAAEIAGNYEYNTGAVIAEEFQRRGLEPTAIPGCLVKYHGPFCWGETPWEAVCHALVVEECAKMALCTERIAAEATPAPQSLLTKHYLRKHGPDAYYGQH